jgi:hypothetical protein
MRLPMHQVHGLSGSCHKKVMWLITTREIRFSIERVLKRAILLLTRCEQYELQKGSTLSLDLGNQPCFVQQPKSTDEYLPAKAKR